MNAIKKMKETHIKKNEDYATEQNPFSNFHFQTQVVKEFKHDQDKVFASLVAVKLARLANLLSSDKVPNNESIEDTFIDAANYMLLWRAEYLRYRKQTST
jgi:hypothetical protein